MNDYSNDDFNLVYDGSSKASIVTFTMSNLIPGKYYRFKVQAVNKIGEGPLSAYKEMYCADIPGVPGQPYLISSTSTSVKFGWTPPVDNGGALITSYEI